MMQYAQNRDIKKRLVKYLRIVYKLNSEWLNEDLEVISLSNDNSPQVYEQYPWSDEKYPIVVINSLGGSQDDWALDSFIGNSWRDYRIGSVPRTYEILDTSKDIALGIKVSDYDFKIRNIGFALKYNVESDYDIDVNLMSAVNGNPDTIIASGSIDATDVNNKLQWCSVELRPQSTLNKNTEYFPLKEIYISLQMNNLT